MADLVTPDGIKYPLEGDRVTLGREESDIDVPDAQASRRHAQLMQQGGRWTISDLGSTNGTFVNGVRVTGTQPLQSGDRIRIGTSVLAFVEGSMPQATRMIGGTSFPQVPAPHPPSPPTQAPVPPPPSFPEHMSSPATAAPPSRAQWQSPPTSHSSGGEYAGRPPKQRSTAMLLEIIAGFFGLLGLGWIYADRSGVGIPMLIVGLLVNITFCVVASLTVGISLIVTIPLQLAAIILSAVLLNGYTKQRSDLFGP